MLIFLASPSMLIFKDVYASTGGKRGQKYVFSSKDLVNLVFQQIMSGIVALMDRGGKMSDCFTIDCSWFVRFVSHMMTIPT